MKVQYEIEIIEYATGEVVKTIPCVSIREAERVDGGVNVNLNYDEYYTLIKSSATDQRPPS